MLKTNPGLLSCRETQSYSGIKNDKDEGACSVLVLPLAAELYITDLTGGSLQSLSRQEMLVKSLNLRLQKSELCQTP